MAHTAGSSAMPEALQVMEAVLPGPEPPSLATLSRARLPAMLVAGEQVLECRRVLKKGGINLVSEVLRGQGEFVEYEHYPREDVYDPDSRAQYYYHAHRGGSGEHGHFHTFIRQPGLVANSRAPHSPSPVSTAGPGDTGNDITHLIAISMDAYGWPTGLFATNRWVTGETWYSAEDVIAALPRFQIDHAWPSWPVNIWIGAMLALFRPHIEALLRHRDKAISAWARAHPRNDVFEDRNLEITGYLPISVDEQVNALRALARGRGAG
jgi:hypothetical protein